MIYHQWINGDTKEFCEVCGLDKKEFTELGLPECISPETIKSLSQWLDGDYSWIKDLKTMAFNIVAGRKPSVSRQVDNAHIMAKLSIVVMTREKLLRETAAEEMKLTMKIIAQLIRATGLVTRHSHDWRKVRKDELKKLQQSLESILPEYNSLLSKQGDLPPPITKKGDTDGTS